MVITIYYYFENLYLLFSSNFFIQISTGNLGNEGLIVTKSGDVYALGSNTAGCLGTGDTHSSLQPRKVNVLCGKGIITFAYGGGPHVLALTENGEIYAWGHNGYSELGNGSTNQCLTPTLCVNLQDKTIVQIACGSHHSMALTKEGEVYAWGQNNCGQVSNGIGTNQSAPRKVNTALAGKVVVSIACGQTSSMAVTDVGEVYGWGYNGVGQLGIGNYVNQLSPVKVSGLNGIVIEKIVCGYAHTLALSDEGVVFVWGGNGYGQLGIGNKANVCAPTKVRQNFRNILVI